MRTLYFTPFEKLLVGMNVANLLDIVLTLTGIHYFSAIEINPVMNWLIEQGDIVFVLFKVIIVGVVSIILMRRHDKHPRTVFASAAACFGILSFACIWNIHQFSAHFIG